jgi:transcriptional regulator with XRE-family HTH domain
MATARIAARLSQVELAKRTGISVSTIQRLEAGDVANPGIRHLLAISEELGCTLEHLVEDDWRPPRPS